MVFLLWRDALRLEQGPLIVNLISLFFSFLESFRSNDVFMINVNISGIVLFQGNKL